MGITEFYYIEASLLFGFVVAAGAAVISISRPDFQVARKCAWVAAILFVSIAVVWGVTTSESFWVRAFGVGIPAFIAAVGLVESLRLIKNLETAHQPQEQGEKAGKLTAPQEVPSLISLFMNDFMSSNGMKWNARADVDQITGDTKRTIHLFYKIVNDVDAGSKFISFYVPIANPTSDIVNFIAKNYHDYFTDIESKHWAVLKSQGTSDSVNSKMLPFSGRVYIYHEEPFSVEQMGDFVKIFRENGASVQFRGPDYILAVWQSILAGAVKPPPRYEIKEGIPTLAP